MNLSDDEYNFLRNLSHEEETPLSQSTRDNFFSLYMSLRSRGFIEPIEITSMGEAARSDAWFERNPDGVAAAQEAPKKPDPVDLLVRFAVVIRSLACDSMKGPLAIHEAQEAFEVVARRDFCEEVKLLARDIVDGFFQPASHRSASPRQDLIVPPPSLVEVVQKWREKDSSRKRLEDAIKDKAAYLQAAEEERAFSRLLATIDPSVAAEHEVLRAKKKSRLTTTDIDYDKRIAEAKEDIVLFDRLCNKLMEASRG